jgi:peptidoglycan/xylan/chitin deacetylase (PgdA/CDA1 family)
MARQPGGHELVAGNPSHRVENAGVFDAARLDLGVDHFAPLPNGVSLNGERQAEQEQQRISHGSLLGRSYGRMLWIFAIGAGLAALSHTAPFPFLLDRFAPAQSLWHMPRGAPPTIYLTFDDGPNPAATPALLDTLRAHGASATFFLIDDHLTGTTAPIVRRMFDEGHAVGIHSNTRALMLKTPDGFADFLESVSVRIEQLGGSRPCRLFRPHAGWRSGSMYAGARRAGYRITGWGWGLWDFNWWRRRDGRAIADRLARRASAGDIIVLHDGHHRNPAADRRYAVETVDRLIPALRQRGFTLGKLCE